jgi:ABC-type sugar transport system ATPase subunit
VVQPIHRSRNLGAGPESPSTSQNSTDASSHRSFASTDLVKAYGNRRALRGVSFAVAGGETLVILGPSGAGKTTLLRVIAGLESPDSGTLTLDGRDLLCVASQRRRVALVFQDDALFPHLSIYDNLAFPLRVKRRARGVVDERVREVAAALDIDAHLRERPARLSGGERQRASLARAVLSDPRLLLLDEPFAHLDPQLRVHVREQFVRFRSGFPGAVIHVTHDHVEALSIGDRLAIMIEGRIEQCAPPQEVYDFPASVTIARFLGSPPMNVIDTGTELLGVRPEHVRLDESAEMRGRTIAVRSTGPDRYAEIETQRGRLMVRASSRESHPGEEVGLVFDPQHVRRFDRSTGLLLR